MKWIGKGTLRVSNDLTLTYGDDIPKNFPKKRLDEFKKSGLVGDVIEKISEHPEVRALKMQISRRDEKIKELETEIETLKSSLAGGDE